MSPPKSRSRREAPTGSQHLPLVIMVCGAVAVLGGLGAVVLAHVVVLPRVEDTMTFARESLDDAQRGLANTSEGYGSTIAVLPDAHALLTHARQTSEKMAGLLDKGGTVTRSMSKAITAAALDMSTMGEAFAAVLPQDVLKESSKELSDASKKLLGTVHDIEGISDGVDDLAGDLGKLATFTASLERLLEPAEESFGVATDTIGRLRARIDDAHLPLVVTAAADGVGALFVLLGLLLIGVGATLQRVVRWDEVRPSARPPLAATPTFWPSPYDARLEPPYGTVTEPPHARR